MAPALAQAHTLSQYPAYYKSFVDGFLDAKGANPFPRFDDLVVHPDVVPFLGAMNVLDLSEPGVGRYIFCGNAVVQHVGMDLTGLNFFELIPEDARNTLAADMAAMLRHPCGNFSQHIDRYTNGKTVVSESLALPLASDKGQQPTRIAVLQESEWTYLSEAQKAAIKQDGAMQVGIEWVKSTFIDVGFGTPGLTELEMAQTTKRGA